MNKQLEPEVQFDCISIGIKLYDYFDGFKREEIQLFSYFSSILFFYTRNPINDGDWKYKFIIDDKGFPFSQELNLAIDQHLVNGHFEEKGHFFTVTARGMKVFNDIKDFNYFSNREKAINAACTTSILVSYEKTERALLNDKEIKRKVKIEKNPLIEQEFIYQKVLEISKKIGAPLDDLIIPAVSWINYLLLTEAENENE